MSLADCFAGCGAGLLFLIMFAFQFLELALGITSVVLGAKWENCYLNDDDIDIYLIVIGSLQIAAFVVYVVFGKKKEDDDNSKNGGPVLLGLAVLGVLIWGMTIVWDTEQGDCEHGPYNYAKYMTEILTFFITAVFGLLLLFGVGSACVAGCTA